MDNCGKNQKSKSNIIKNNYFTMNDKISINNSLINNSTIYNNIENKKKEELSLNFEYKINNNIENNILRPYYFYFINNKFPYFSNNFHNFSSSQETNMQKNNKIMAKYNKKNILNSLKNYWGSINLQLIISNMDSNDISSILFNILPYINEIMCLEYGNYFFKNC